MKKLILILVLLTVLVIVLGLPAAIGWFVHDRLSATAAERLPDAQIEWNRGWFRSGMRVEDEDFSARLDFRHASPGAGWFSVDGLVTLSEWAAAIDLDARLALDGTLSARANAPRLDVPGPVSWRYEAPELSLTASRGGDTELSGAADGLLIVDGIGNRLAFSEPKLEFRMQSESMLTSSARVTLVARRLDRPESRIAVRLESIDEFAMAELIEALRQLAGAEPGSTTTGLAAIGVASAWQQLAAGGLVIDIEELVLDGALSLSGRWAPGKRQFALEGEGARATAEDWLASITGLAEQLPPEQARRDVRATLQDLAGQGAITLDRQQIAIDLHSMPQIGREDG